MTPEGRVKARVVKLLKRLGVYYFSPQTGGYGKSGVPDIIVCAYGHFVGIECKRDALHVPTALQSAQMEAIEKSGGIAYVVEADNIDMWEHAFEALVLLWRNDG